MRRLAIALTALATPAPLVAQDSPGGPAEQTTAAAIVRIQRLDPQLHSIIALAPTALGQADAFGGSGRPIGPIAGQPVLIKDNIESAGPLPTTAGSLALARNVTNRDAPLVA